MIAQLGITNKTFLNLDCRDLMEYDLPLYKQLLTYPAETIGIFDMVLQDYITLENIDLPFIQVCLAVSHPRNLCLDPPFVP
jgi:DNA replicative helicase MCM subunit Mcm2 (Cdc46/Mcm family)